MSRPSFVVACYMFSVSRGFGGRRGGWVSSEREAHGGSQIEPQWNSKNETQHISRLHTTVLTHMDHHVDYYLVYSRPQRKNGDDLENHHFSGGI